MVFKGVQDDLAPVIQPCPCFRAIIQRSFLPLQKKSTIIQIIHGFSKEGGGARQEWCEVCVRDPMYLRMTGSRILGFRFAWIFLQSDYGLLTVCDGMGALEKRKGALG